MTACWASRIGSKVNIAVTLIVHEGVNDWMPLAGLHFFSWWMLSIGFPELAHWQ